MSKQSVLETLYSSRKEWMDLTKRNNFDIGIKRLLTDTYPDQAHFIFEMIQNAEDAQATTVHLELHPDRLIFKHDGKRLFTERDVEGLTNIGNSSKVESGEYDTATIGKFGIGFKAVFAYTLTPEIHSGGFHFKIQDLVVPVPVTSLENLDESLTCFILHFNTPEKTAEKCFSEIQSWFETVHTEILLFLKNIHTLSWKLSEQAECIMKRNDYPKKLVRVRLEQSTEGEKPLVQDTWWLVLRGDVSLSSAGGKAHYLALAFALNPQGSDINPDVWEKHPGSAAKIRRVTEGQLFIYFPADKESTGLYFHVHGPYTPTMSRDSISHDRIENQEIIAKTGDLLCKELPTLCHWGLIDNEFLSTLPNSDDTIKDFYNTIRKQLYYAFNYEKLLPIWQHSDEQKQSETTPLTVEYGAGYELVRGPNELKQLLSPMQIMFLFGKKNWVATAWRYPRTVSFFSGLGMKTINREVLIDELKNRFYNHYYSPIMGDSTWLQSQSIDWLKKLFFTIHGYLLSLGNKKNLYEYESWHVVPNQQGELHKGKLLYFPNDLDASESGDFNLIHPDLLKHDSQEQIIKMKDMLKVFGVREIDELEKVKMLLNKHYATDKFKRPSDDIHKKHIKQLINAWSTNVVTIEMLKEFALLKSERQNNMHDFFLTPDRYYIDSSFQSTGLHDFYRHSVEFLPLWSGYQDIHPAFDKFIKAIGVKSTLKVSRQEVPLEHPHVNKLKGIYIKKGASRSTGIDEDYIILGLPGALASISFNISKVIWKKLSETKPDFFTAKFQSNRKTELCIADSTLIHLLKTHAWIPDKALNFLTPAEINPDDLHEEFIVDNRNGWLTAIDFGKRAQEIAEQKRIESEQYQNSLQAAETIIPKSILETLMSLNLTDMESDELNTVAKSLEKAIVMAQKQIEKERNLNLQAENASEADEVPDFAKLIHEAIVKKAPLPEEAQNNPLKREQNLGPGKPEFYEERIREEVQEEKAKHVEQGSRQSEITVRKKVNSKNVLTREFLTAEYQGKCQMCGGAFTKRDGQAYFENVYLLPVNKHPWADQPGNAISLCADCAARYKYGSVVATDLIANILKTEVQPYTDEQFDFYLLLCENSVSLTYSPRHLIQFQALIRANSQEQERSSLRLESDHEEILNN